MIFIVIEIIFLTVIVIVIFNHIYHDFLMPCISVLAAWEVKSKPFAVVLGFIPEVRRVPDIHFAQPEVEEPLGVDPRSSLASP